MSHFSADFTAARATFVESARAAGGALERTGHPQSGPSGEDLSTDVAWFGPRSATRVFVAISGVHGVEGFFGSAVQAAWMHRQEYRHMADGVATLLVHAINPFGFAWLRRTNEENVDLNRNWIDFERTLPANLQYDEIASDLCPATWTAAAQAETGTRLTAWRERNGMAAFQKAVTGGQWHHPKGLFFGGTGPSWSRQTLTRILQGYLSDAERVMIVDFHTGLGAHGYAEPIIHRRRSDPAFARTRAWIGAGATSIYGGGSSSAELQGDGLSAIPGLLPKAVVDGVALECGVLPFDKVGAALRADNWLHAYGDPASPDAADIKQRVRAAFCSDDPTWQGMSLGQGLTACRAALGGLASGL